MTGPVLNAAPTGSAPVLLWFRRDLRLDDHPALREAVQLGPVIPVFVLEEDAAVRALGEASQWWLHHSLAALRDSLARLGAPLILRRGNPEELLPALAQECGASAVVWSRTFQPADDARDGRLAGTLKTLGITPRRFGGHLLFDPQRIRTKNQGSFQVFTPFWRACLAQGAPTQPLPAPETLPLPDGSLPQSLSLEALDLLPEGFDWTPGLGAAWKPGEAGAQERLRDFTAVISDYHHRRDVPGFPGTSRLSPHLHFGEITPRRLWHSLRGQACQGSEAFLREVGWREFCHHLLLERPDAAERPMKSEFTRFPWRTDEEDFHSWCDGLTGYPLVDAGMRELWQTGWMHNRVRMVAASFLVKHLLLPWQWGEQWFWDTLVDADLANNAAGWQWVTGCGADAAPFFRIFSPVAQGEKFDPKGDYVRRWVPELKDLPDEHIHCPWEAPPALLARANVTLGETYPHPIVAHDIARRRALAALGSLKDKKG